MRMIMHLAALIAIGMTIGSPPDIAGDLKALRDEYSKAQQDFFKEYQAAKTDAEREALFKEKYPGPKFKDRALDLLKRAKGDPAEMDVILFAFDFARQDANGAKTCTELAKRVVDQMPTHAKIGQFAAMIGYPIDPKDARSMLATLVEKNRGKKSEPALLYRQASNLKGWGQPSPEDEKAATAIFHELTRKFPDSMEAEQAKGDLFELQNLVVGKVFPDFEATDENGKAWKLSDYRGKVVVVDFWGFW